MPAPNAISAAKLARLLGRSDAPAILDIRTDEDFGPAPRLVPGSVRRSRRDVADWAGGVRGRSP